MDAVWRLQGELEDRNELGSNGTIVALREELHPKNPSHLA
jgi:hypothetical protein